MIALAKMLQEKFSLIPIASYHEINQNGKFLAFDGMDNIKPNINLFKFNIIIVANSLMRDKDNLLDQISKLEKEIFLISSHEKQVWLKSIKSGFITNSLYAYSLNLEIQKSRQI